MDPSRRSGASRKRSGAAADDARAHNQNQTRRRAGTDGSASSASRPQQPEQPRVDDAAGMTDAEPAGHDERLVEVRVFLGEEEARVEVHPEMPAVALVASSAVADWAEMASSNRRRASIDTSTRSSQGSGSAAGANPTPSRSTRSRKGDATAPRARPPRPTDSFLALPDTTCLDCRLDPSFADHANITCSGCLKFYAKTLNSNISNYNKDTKANRPKSYPCARPWSEIYKDHTYLAKQEHYRNFLPSSREGTIQLLFGPAVQQRRTQR